MMKTTRHSLMAKGILVLLSLLIMVFVFTYSWYIDPNTPATASGMSLTTNAGADYDVAIGFQTHPDSSGNYEYIVSDWIDPETGVNFEQIPYTKNDQTLYYNLLDSNYFKPIDLTSNGVDFVRPAMLNKNIGIDTDKDTYEIAQKNQQYISFDLIFRSKTNGLTIKLDTDSCVFGNVEGSAPDVSKLIGSSVSNKSDFGNFSEDSVVGAVRVSFVNYDNGMDTFEEIAGDYTTLANSARLLWIPRPDLYLEQGSTDSTWVLHSSAAGYNDSYWDETSDETYMVTPLTGGSKVSYKEYSQMHVYYAIKNSNQGGSGNYQSVSAVYNISDPTANTTICDLGFDHVSVDEYYYGKCQVNIWVDGCDAEARRAVNGGQFKLTFKLTTA